MLHSCTSVFERHNFCAFGDVPTTRHLASADNVRHISAARFIAASFLSVLKTKANDVGFILKWCVSRLMNELRTATHVILLIQR